VQRHASIIARSRSTMARYLGSVGRCRSLSITTVRRRRPRRAHVAGGCQYASQSDVHPAFVAAEVEDAGRVPLPARHWHALRARSVDVTRHAVDEPVRGPNSFLLPRQSPGPVARLTNISPYARPTTVSARAGPTVPQSGGAQRARSLTYPAKVRACSHRDYSAGAAIRPRPRWRLRVERQAGRSRRCDRLGTLANAPEEPGVQRQVCV
jgi:hypothetical protein